MSTGVIKKSVRRNRDSKPALPNEAGRAVIDGKEFILFPSEDFEAWFEDQILVAMANERLKNERRLAIPMEDVFAQQNARRKGK